MWVFQRESRQRGRGIFIRGGLGKASARHRKKERWQFAGDNKMSLVTSSGGSGRLCPPQTPESGAG